MRELPCEAAWWSKGFFVSRSTACPGRYNSAGSSSSSNHRTTSPKGLERFLSLGWDHSMNIGVFAMATVVLVVRDINSNEKAWITALARLMVAEIAILVAL